MTRRTLLKLAGAAPLTTAAQPRRQTEISIDRHGFLIDGKPTYAGRSYTSRPVGPANRGANDMSVEGLLFNARMVQGIFDDRNPETRSRWAYPDTGKWDPDRNTREFVAAMPEWRRHGLLSFTINLQGGSPEGYSKAQPWDNTAIDPDGGLRPDYMQRLESILDRADQLGMAPILGLFYFGQDQRVHDEMAVKRAVENAVDWVLTRGYRNVLLEIDNECDVREYDHEILKPARVHELIELAKGIRRQGRRLLVGTSYGGGSVPLPNVIRPSDFILMHGNGVQDPARIARMVEQVRNREGYRPMPVLFNEDDHFDFDRPRNNMLAALSVYASWGYFDPEGYQSPPVNWGINTERKRAFFNLLKEVTGASPTPNP